jgi:hypothetical protein
MSQPLHHSIPPATAADISPLWLHQVRAVVLREGYALRGGFPDITIEVQNINVPEIWQPLNLQTNTAHFATDRDRDQVLAILTGEKPLPELPKA